MSEESVTDCDGHNNIEVLGDSSVRLVNNTHHMPSQREASFRWVCDSAQHSNCVDLVHCYHSL